MLRNISGTNAATWQQKLATDFPSMTNYHQIFDAYGKVSQSNSNDRGSNYPCLGSLGILKIKINNLIFLLCCPWFQGNHSHGQVGGLEDGFSARFPDLNDPLIWVSFKLKVTRLVTCANNFGQIGLKFTIWTTVKNISGQNCRTLTLIIKNLLEVK